MVTNYGVAKGSQAYIEKIAERPLGASFNIDSSTFSFYKLGLIKQYSNMCTQHDSNNTNHQMVIVGYDADGAEGTYQAEQ